VEGCTLTCSRRQAGNSTGELGCASKMNTKCIQLSKKCIHFSRPKPGTYEGIPAAWRRSSASSTVVYARVLGLTTSKRSPAWTSTSGFCLIMTSIADRKLSYTCFSRRFIPLSGSRRLNAARPRGCRRCG